MNAAKKDVVFSNLPLLFCNGKPTSLESMTAVRIQNTKHKFVLMLSLTFYF